MQLLGGGQATADQLDVLHLRAERRRRLREQEEVDHAVRWLDRLLVGVLVWAGATIALALLGNHYGWGGL